VNIETDVIGKYVARYLSGMASSGGLTAEKLREHGFG
jgi:riboflavin synthase alpha subunit